MTQAIVTKYLGPTNYRGARVKATAQAGSITHSWDHAYSVSDNHRIAANLLMMKFKWNEHYDIAGSGELPDGRGSCFVMKGKTEQ